MLARAVTALIAAPVLAAIAGAAPALAAAPAHVTAASGSTPPAACGAAGYPAGYGIWCPGRIHLVTAGDSLRALARKYLGDGDRWPAIWILGTATPRPCGSSAEPPGQIFPGEILLIPAAGQAAPPAWCQPGTWQPQPGTKPSTAPPGGSPRTAAPARTSTRATARLLPDLALAAAALAAGAALAFAVRRRGTGPGRRARWPRPRVRRPAARWPGSRTNHWPGGPGAQPWPPDRWPAPQPGKPGRPGWPAASPEPPPPARRVWSPALGTGAPDTPRRPGEIPVGIRGQQEAAASIAALRGVGLTGPGAEAAARAMLATVLSLARPSPPGLPAPVIVPAGTGLLPPRAGAPRTVLAQPPSLAAALDLTEALILQLARLSDDDPAAGPPPDAAVPAALFAGPSPDDEPRLRGITAAGQDLGLITVIVGTWTSGTTCHVAADGTITAATPPGSGLEGVRLFQLTDRDLAGLAAVIDGQVPAAPAHEAVPGPAAEPDRTWQPLAPGEEQPGPGAGQAAPAARIGVLGPLQISAGGQEISAGFRKARELLAFLAVCGPQGASSDAVTEALWPEATSGHGARQRNTALRKARDLLRAHVGAASEMWILFAGDRYRLDQDLITVDLWEFRAALDAARDASGDGGRLAAYRRATGLYRGPLCEGAGYEWAEQYAEAARRSVLDAWTRTAELLQDTDPEQALAALESAAANDPHNEDTYLQIMRLQAAAGRADAARRTYQLMLTRLRELDLTGPRPAIRLAAAGLLGETGPQPGSPADATARRGR